MGKKTKIDWCDSSWNPVTGCLHGCEYCYARRIAERFGGGWHFHTEPDEQWRAGRDYNYIPCGDWAYHSNGGLHVLDECALNVPYKPYPGEELPKDKAPYPFYFDPTFRRYKLDEPQHWKKPRNIFVCSMADLFGDWVPDEWISEVFAACEKAPQHRYMFLTKNPERYIQLAEAGKLPKGGRYWYGSTATHEQMDVYWAQEYNTFVSIEPILERFDCDGVKEASTFTDWIIVGAETGNRKDKVIPKKAWIDEIAEYAKQSGVPIFMKESLRGLMGDSFRQEYPWDIPGAKMP